MKRFSGSLFFLLFSFAPMLWATVLQAQTDAPQTPSQTVRGWILNAATQQPVPGAVVQIPELKKGANSRPDGSYKIPSVPAGRYTLRVTALGYEATALPIVVTSGKETVLRLELSEKIIKTNEVSISGTRGGYTAINEAAAISATMFSVDDAYRFAGSRGDPARMAQNFAGVLGANDQRNDIIIRGGSPTELLWRLDGLDIPNPNHFATQGATGGPINALNINLLENSDFMTGAFPAEYGDRMSGVFDLRTRKGNSEKYEFMGMFSMAGLEAMAEGPLPVFSKSSFIVNYRHSFLGLMEAMGVKLGWVGIPYYKDVSLKMDFSLGDRDNISITGLYGTSDIFLDRSKLDTNFTGDRNIKNGTDILTLGATWQHLYSERSYGTLTLGTVFNKYLIQADSITATPDLKIASLFEIFRNISTEGYHLAKYRYSYAPNAEHTITAGIEGRLRYYDLSRQLYSLLDGGNLRVSENGSSFQSFAFGNWMWRASERLTTNLGLHSQYLGISGKTTIEPRASLVYELADGHKFSAGWGVYNQSQSLMTYFSTPNNKSLDFMQAIHYVSGYSTRLAEGFVAKAEGYYKDYSHIGVEATRSNGYSLINAGATFGGIEVYRDVSATGKARSYGAELSLIKNFSDGYYFTATGSLVRQEYVGSDGVWRWGAFDNRYIFNVLGGYEWKFSPTFSMEFSGKYTQAGGAPASPVDLQRSQATGVTWFDEAKMFSERNPDYSRLDIRIDFRHNMEGWSIISFVSVENVLNRQNVSFQQYNLHTNKIETAYQLGFFPVGGVKIEF